MLYLFGAHAIVIFHFCFVLFVLSGGILVLRKRWVALLHVPAVMWGMYVEWSGQICPLTPLENWLRSEGGGTPYEGGFVEHYIMPVLYPHDLTRDFQITLGTIIAVSNALLYFAAFVRLARRRSAASTPAVQRA